jgi:2-C-methyl-D-erythritol 2,4-cyclodiphosphate synthase
MKVRTGIGQDSHKFATDPEDHIPLFLGGVRFEGEPRLEGESDGDAVLHALTRAICGVTGVNVVMPQPGITSSVEYVEQAIARLGILRISHVSISILGRRPRIDPKRQAMKERIAEILGLSPDDVGITASTGELTPCGEGQGVMVTAIVTATEE